MTHDLAIQEAKEACSARKAVGEHLLAYLEKEINRCGEVIHRSAMYFWASRIRDIKDL
jgi:hypothetical protein